MIRSLSLAIPIGAVLFASSGAFAADIIAADPSYAVQPVRMVCESSGRCWRVGPHDEVLGDAHNYYGGRVCVDPEGYPCSWRGAAIPRHDFESGPAFRYRY